MRRIFESTSRADRLNRKDAASSKIGRKETILLVDERESPFKDDLRAKLTNLQFNSLCPFCILDQPAVRDNLIRGIA